MTLKHKSPNACNLCHRDKGPEWANAQVQERGDYQEPYLLQADLIEGARKRDFSRLPEMLAYLESKDKDAIVSVSLIRLLRACNKEAIPLVLLKSLDDPSPHVRSAAAESLAAYPTQEVFQALVKACEDEYRVVRVRAAGALAGLPIDQVKTATGEYLNSLKTRPDQWASHYNLGNYYYDCKELSKAIDAYETALRLEPRAVIALVNSSMAYAGMGNKKKAEDSLMQALKIEPNSAAAHFNMGLLAVELNRPDDAEFHLRTALKNDPQLAAGAYNLGILVAEQNLEETLKLLKQAYELNPAPNYGYTLAYYLKQSGDTDHAIGILNQTIKAWPLYGDAYLLLGEMYKNDREALESLIRKLLDVKGFNPQERHRLERALKAYLSPK